MPSRIIRDGILDSDKYAQLSDSARLLFFHLMLLADDYGCVHAGATFLRRRAFFDSPNDARIAKLLGELVDVDLIRTYEHEQGCYAFIPRFRQRLDRYKLSHPKPPESLLHGDDHAIEKFSRINQNSENLPTNCQPNGGKPERMVARSEEKGREEKKSFTPESSIRAQNPVDKSQVKTPTPNAWWLTEAGTDEQARKVGAYPARPGESYSAYRDRIRTTRVV